MCGPKLKTICPVIILTLFTRLAVSTWNRYIPDFSDMWDMISSKWGKIALSISTLFSINDVQKLRDRYNESRGDGPLSFLGYVCWDPYLIRNNHHCHDGGSRARVKDERWMHYAYSPARYDITEAMNSYDFDLSHRLYSLSIRRCTLWSRKISKQRDCVLDWSYRAEISQAPRLLPRRLWNFRAIVLFKSHISQVLDFMIS